MKKILISTLVVLLLVTGCKQIPKLENGKEAVVSLKDDKIAVDDLYSELKEKYALSILLDMTDEKILDKKYETSDEEKDYIKLQKENDETYYNLIYSQSYKTYEYYLQSRYGVTSQDELDEIFKLSYRRELATKDYAKSQISESEITDYYNDEFIADIEASHILITAEYADNATEEEKETAKQNALNQAKEIIEKLKNGEDFAELAKQYSKDGSAANGGALGRFGSGDMTPEFEKAAYALKVGEYSKEPVQTKYGYHIILKTKEYDKDPLETAKEEIVKTLTDRKISEDNNISYKALKQLREDYGFTIEDSVLKEQYENYVYNTSN